MITNGNKNYNKIAAEMENALERVIFESKPLEWNYRRLIGSVRNGLAPLSKLLKGSDLNFNPKYFGCVYGDFSKLHHMFNVAPIDWGFRFTEPQITNGLAHFLSQPENKVARLKAFMIAFGIKPPGDETILKNAQIKAESDSTERDRTGSTKRRGRIDLEILYDPLENSRGQKTHQKALIIEAKLGHKVSREQLQNYRVVASKRVVDPQYFILAQHDGDEERLHHKQRQNWSIVYWDHVLIAFEKELLKAGDTDESFRLFRRTLWERIDGSNRKRSGVN